MYNFGRSRAFEKLALRELKRASCNGDLSCNGDWRLLPQQFPAMELQRTAILSGQEGHQQASYSAAETSLTRGGGR